MALKYRDEIVGKRFLCVRKEGKLKLSKISEWEWRSGVIRAISGRDITSVDLSVLIEFDDIDWERREWIRIYDIYQIFLVENTLIWAERTNPYKLRGPDIIWPALNFKSIVDKIGLSNSRKKPVEFLIDHLLCLLEDRDITIHQDGDELIRAATKEHLELQQITKAWLEYQDGQKILLTTPTVLVGYRVEVYRAEGTTQWYTAVIQSYNDQSKNITVTDDTVLEEHNEDPALIQMHLIDDGVVDSILRGEEIGIASRRRPRNNNKEKDHQYIPQSHYIRHRSQSPIQPLLSRAPTSRKPRARHASGSSTSTEPEKGVDKPSNKERSSTQKERKRRSESTPEETKKSQVSAPGKRSKAGTPNNVGTKTNVSNTVIDKAGKKELHAPDNNNKKRNRTAKPKPVTDSKEVIINDIITAVAAEVKSDLPLVAKGKSKPAAKIKSIVDNLKKSKKESKPSKSPKLNNKQITSAESVTETKKKEVYTVENWHPVVDYVPTKSKLNHLDSPKLDKRSTETLSDEDKDMHFKKQILLNNSEKTSQASIVANIDVNRSVTDQIAKFAKYEKLALNGDGNNSDLLLHTTSAAATQPPDHHSAGSNRPIQEFKRETDTGASQFDSSHSAKKSSKHGGDTSTASTTFVSAVDIGASSGGTYNCTSAVSNELHYIANNRVSSEDRPVSTSSEERCRPGSQLDDIRSNKNSPASSPLIIDRNEPVNPYRDPELMRKNPVHSMLGHPPKPASQPSYPHTPIPTTPATIPPTASTTLPSHPMQRPTMMSQLHYQMSAALSPHLTGLPPSAIGQLDAATLASRTLQQQQQHLAMQYPANAHLLQLSSYPGLQANINLQQLELLWQQKHPTIPVPPAWLLAKHQDDLIRDATFRERELEREHYERERLEHERLDRIERDRRIELERLDRERIERERQEKAAERERVVERERAERDRAEKERAERERQERERQERSRIDREQRHKRERVIKESAEAVRAVDQHFTESLRIASQRGVWHTPPITPSITKGIGKGSFSPKSESQSQAPSRPFSRGSEKGSDHKEEKKASEESVKQDDAERSSLVKEEHKQDQYYRESGRGKMDPHHRDLLLRQSEEKRLLMLKQEELMKHQLMYYESQKKALAEHYKSDQPEKKSTPPSTTTTDSKAQQAYAAYYQQYGAAAAYAASASPPTTAAGPQQQVKQEPNFNLYGYQPFQHSYITSDQLQLRGLSTGSEKQDGKEGKGHQLATVSSPSDSLSSRSGSPSVARKGALSVPPPLIKDNNSRMHTSSHGSVIVDNRLKSSGSPHGSSQYGSSPMSSPSPRPTKGVGTSEKVPERPRSTSSSTSSPVTMPPSHYHGLSASAGAVNLSHLMDGKTRSQSPLHVASPQQLSAAVMDYQRLPANKPKTNHAGGGNPMQMSAHAAMNHLASAAAYSAAIQQQQAAASLPNSAHGNPHQQHPIYSQSGVSNSTMVSEALSRHKHSTSPPSKSHAHHSLARSPPPAHSNAGGAKRKTSRDGATRKRQKMSSAAFATLYGDPAHMTIPVTTPKILTNPSPYTTTSDVNSSSPSSTTTTSSSSSSAATSMTPHFVSRTAVKANVLTAASLLSTAGASFSKSSGFMDSFKSFVENTVQNAFLQDNELSANYNKAKLTTMTPATTNESSTSQQQQSTPTSHQQMMSEGHPPSNSPPSRQTVAPLSSTQQQQCENFKMELTNASTLSEDSKPFLSSFGMSSAGSSTSSSASIMDTINRVANGLIDTDSDTLSAPSPPSSIKPEACPSPGRSSSSATSSACHPRLKKDWLQRHSDEADEEKETKCQSKEADGGDGKSSDMLRNCYVNCSYISPSKEGGSRSPISALVLPNGNPIEFGDSDGESTTSASEIEVKQYSTDDDNSLKRKVLSKKKSAKKIKLEEEEEENISMPKPAIDFTMETEKRVTPSVADELAKKLIQDKIKQEAMLKVERSSPPPEVAPLTLPPQVLPPQVLPPSKEKEKKPRSRKKEAKEPAKSTAAWLYKNKPLVKVSMATLKKTCQSFLQDGSCSEMTPKLMKCRECKMTPMQRSKKLPNIFCRFYAFRRLRFSQKGYMTIAGFSELSDAEPDDIEPWASNTPITDPVLDVDTAKFIVAKVGDKFCELVQQEKEAYALEGNPANIAWKRAVTGVREMCDVCDTTLFNMHWVCKKCGFVVCLDCYKVRMQTLKEDTNLNTVFPEDEHEWLTCSANRQAHEPGKLMLTQIIPSDALWKLGDYIHEIQYKWGIPSQLSAGTKFEGIMTPKNGVNQQLLKAVNSLPVDKNKRLVNGIGMGHPLSKSRNKKHSTPEVKNSTLTAYSTASPLSILADVASMDSEKNKDPEPLKSSSHESTKPQSGNNKVGLPADPLTDAPDSDKKVPASCSTLRELLTKTAGGKMKQGTDTKKRQSKGKSTASTLDDIIQSVVEKSMPKEMDSGGTTTDMVTLKHYVPRGGRSTMMSNTLVLVHNLTETSVLYPDIPHSWLCDGRLLRLHDSRHKGNLKIFQEQWKRGQPVLVSGVDRHMNTEIWKPDAFSKEFGHIKNDLVNTRTGVVHVGHYMEEFWKGFEHLSERLLDDDNEPMLLKLKDWPPGDDFCDLLPGRFRELLQALPLPEYTHRNGCFNLVSRLPDFLVKPDLGPKMYNAYGSASFPSEATTNLHLDVSDAVNVMVYVGIPDDGPGGRKAHQQAAVTAIDDAGGDIITKRRVREIQEIPGALWHIYDAQDADKIRDLLNMVAKEKGEIIEPDTDAIHDQSWYLDEMLRERLLKEYKVQGYTIIQCLGDAVFIPAGAPHQVRNLHSCVKVAEDFVSPEHMNHCFRMTQEFRLLSDQHSNHEDKLQVKNIIYHAVKDAVAILTENDPED